MKKLLSILMLSLLGACGSQPIKLPPELLTAQQIVAKVCPIVQTVNLAITTFPEIDPKILAVMITAKPAVDIICADNAIINVTNLQTFSTSALPVLLDAVKSSLLPADKVAQISTDIGVAQVIVAQAIAVQTISTSVPTVDSSTSVSK